MHVDTLSEGLVFFDSTILPLLSYKEQSVMYTGNI